MPTIVFADAAAVIADYLRFQLAAFESPAPVATRVPPSRPSIFVLVRRLGGPRLNVVADEPLIGVECWAPTEGDAHDLAQLCRALIHAMRGTEQGGVAVYRIAEAAGPQELPDPLSNDPRYVFTVSVAVRGSGPVGPIGVYPQPSLFPLDPEV